MLAKSFISAALFPLKETDTVDFAIEMMEDYGVRQLPVVQNGQILGLVNLTAMYASDAQSKLQDVFLGEAPVVDANHSFFRVLHLSHEKESDVVVVTELEEYAGLIRVSDLARSLGSTFAVKGEGAVIYAQCHPRNYALSAISQSIESEDGKIQAFWSEMTESGMLQMLIKLNIQHVDIILENLEKMHIEVLLAVNRQDNELLKGRYQALMKYLEF
jgi:acetoin utilization protein AcuB